MLFEIPKPKKESPYVLTEIEKLASNLLPVEIIRATEHDVDLLERLVAKEVEEAEWQHTIQDVFKALSSGDAVKLVRAVKHITSEKRKELVKQYYYGMLKRHREGKELNAREVFHFDILRRKDIDLFHLCLMGDKR